MNRIGKKANRPLFLKAWFGLTANERLYIAVILLIALIGLTARYFHLKNEEAEMYNPIELTE